MKENKTNVETLNELINPETFAFERGSDYGKGTPATTSQITSKKITDTAVKMIASVPSRLNGSMGPVMNSYLGEDSLTGPKPKRDLHQKEDEDCEENNCSKLSSVLRKKIRTLAQEIKSLDSEGQKTGVELLNKLLIIK